MIPELATERLILRGWRLDDFPAYAEFYGDKDLRKFVGGRAPLAQAWEAFCGDLGHWVLRNYGVFAIEVRARGQVAGFAGLWHPIDLAEPELCWSLFRGHQGKGYATEAARRAQVWANKVLGLPALMSYVHPKNTASCKVAERLGAVCEGKTELRGMPRLFYRHCMPGADTETIEV
jgi:RimJ/RimL family protein N-acetyltransferase